MHWYTDVLRKYAVFSGRADRPEFWWFQLANIIVAIIIGIIAAAILGRRGGQGIGYLYDLAVLLPSLGVSIRRLHDTDRSGWWLLLSFLPVIGWIVLIVFYALEGTPGPNNHGPDPKGRGGVAPAMAGAPGTGGGFCANCGSPLAPGAAFCANCGATTGTG